MPKGKFVRKEKPSIKEVIKENRKIILEMNPIEIKRNTKYIIHFEDHGQDFLKWYLDERGYVLDSQPFQRNVWVGKSTVPDFVQVGALLPIFMEEKTGHDCFSHVNYPIKKIEVMDAKRGKRE